MFTTDHRVYGTNDRHHVICEYDRAALCSGAGQTEAEARAACIAAAERVALELSDWIAKEKAK